MTVMLSRDAQHIIVPWREDLAALIPHARVLDHKGERLLVMPNRHQEAKVARNLGVPVPAPILTRYDWAGQKPWDVQRTTSALLTESPRCYVLSTMGTGKTRAALFAADYLMQSDHAIKRVLISAPLSTLTPVWESEMFRVLPNRTTVVLYGDKAKRRKLLERDADFYVINHHGLDLLQSELIARGFQIVVIDELAVFRTKNTRLWKAANAVVSAPATIYAWGLTGSPTPHAPTDAWAQIRLLTPGRTSRTMSQFQDQTMRKMSNFVWKPRDEANAIVLAAMQPSVRFTLDDVAELPPTVYLDREVKLEPAAAAVYKMLYQKMRTQSAQGESITAVNEGVLQNKLLQVACGYLYTDKRTVYALPNQTRLDTLEELIDEADRKVIIFVPYLHALDGVVRFLADHKHKPMAVHGGTSRAMRDKIFRQFQDDPERRPLVAHPQCMAHGLTLTSANTIVWFSPTQSLEIYEQANARIVRPSQTSRTLIAHLFGTAVEKAVYRRLRERAKMQGLLMEMFKNQEVEF